MVTETIYETLENLRTKYVNWELELAEHSGRCPLCWSISEASTAHRLARLGR